VIRPQYSLHLALDIRTIHRTTYLSSLFLTMTIAARTILVTGSSGLIGSEVCTYFDRMGWRVHGVDSNQRAVFFGPAGDTRWNQRRLEATLARFTHHELDIRDRPGVLTLVEQVRPNAIVHTAAQPSHDRAAAIPFDDFDTNAVGTLNLLEAARRHVPSAPFVHMSTNKVYGDAPNEIPRVELETRWDYADVAYAHGIPETFRIDRSKHSLFGASKVAADVMVQEYGRYFEMPTCCLRGGCLTGPSHSGVELHGFLSYLVKCNVEQRPYTVFGYKGKQVRDNIHSQDVAEFIARFIDSPRPAAVYNIGGGKANSCSVLEAFTLVAARTGKPMKWAYDERAREGDHICYYSDLREMMKDYPGWEPRISLGETIDQIVAATQERHSPP
jgi:CDP-paratose 2-epimerase